MKKVFAFLFCLLLTFSISFAIHAEEVEPDTEPVIEETQPEVAPCKVIIGECIYGGATVDIEEGNVGDIVTIYPNTQIFCRLSAVKVNGVILAKNAQGSYQFALAEGDNIVQVEGEVSQEDMKIIVDMIEKAEKGSWEDIFSFNNIINLVFWAVGLLMSGGFLVTLLRNKKIKAITASELSAKVESIVPETVTSVVKDNFQPVLTNISKLTKEINEACNTLVRCMMIMQENTPEARIAVSKELASLNRTGQDLEKQVKDIIDQEILRIEAAKAEKQQALNTLEQKNNEVVEKFISQEEKETINDDLRGRI